MNNARPGILVGVLLAPPLDVPVSSAPCRPIRSIARRWSTRSNASRGAHHRWRDLGWADFLDGNGAQAADEVERALALDPRDARALFARAALIYHEAGHFAAARDAWVAILEHADAADPWADTHCRDGGGKLVALAGDVPGEPAFAARLARIDAHRFSREVEARLLAVRAWLARHAGTNVRARAWMVCGVARPVGRLPVRLAVGPTSISRAAFPLTTTTGAKTGSASGARTRACIFSAENPTGRAGVAYVTTWIEAQARRNHRRHHRQPAAMASSSTATRCGARGLKMNPPRFHRARACSTWPSRGVGTASRSS